MSLNPRSAVQVQKICEFRKNRHNALCRRVEIQLSEHRRAGQSLVFYFLNLVRVFLTVNRFRFLNLCRFRFSKPEIQLSEPEIQLPEPEIQLSEPEIQLPEPEISLPETPVRLLRAPVGSELLNNSSLLSLKSGRRSAFPSTSRASAASGFSAFSGARSGSFSMPF